MNFSYETHYKSNRSDKRHTATMAAFSERLRNTSYKYELPENLTEEAFNKWKNELVNKLYELLQLSFWQNEAKNQPAPKKLNSVKRDGYTVEKWEFYPDSYSAVPFLALIPDCANANNPVPAVMCLPGSIHSKEFISGEPLLDSEACKFVKYPERNMMALYMVKNGYAAFAFDNPATAECALEIETKGDYGHNVRKHLSHGLLQFGLSYFGMSTAQKLCALDFIKTLPYVDTEKIAVSAHSLGCDDAMHLALLRDEIKAVIFNDMVCDKKHRYYSITECDENKISESDSNWHIIPGFFRNFSRVELLCAVAPKYLALNEGGAKYHLDKIQNTFTLFNAKDKLQITHYPKFQDESKRCKTYEPLEYGLDNDTYFEYTNTDAPDHSFRQDPSVKFLNKVFTELK